MKLFAFSILCVMYMLMMTFPRRRTWMALGAAALVVVTGILPYQKVIGAINWNVLLMIAGTMVIVHYFIDSKMPRRIAGLLMKRCSTVLGVTIAMSVFAGVISAFIDNVATVLMVAPVAIAICKELEINPIPMVLSVAVSSNLQGAATLVGDTTSIMLGNYAGMDFIDFFWMNGKPGIFFAVELGALSTVAVMYALFYKEKQKIKNTRIVKAKDRFPTVMLVLVILVLIGISFLPSKPANANGFVCVSAAFLTMLWDYLETGKPRRVVDALLSVDRHLLLLLIALFLVIAGVTEAGVINDFSIIIIRLGGANRLVLFVIIVIASVIISAFVDNIPYVATMLPVIAGVTSYLGVEPYLFYFGLLSGATLGGNLTPFGASANLTGVSLLTREGRTPSFREFARIGVPFTLAAVLVSSLFLWLVWGF